MADGNRHPASPTEQRFRVTLVLEGDMDPDDALWTAGQPEDLHDWQPDDLDDVVAFLRACARKRATWAGPITATLHIERVGASR